MKTIGEIIKEERLKRNITQKDLARLSGINVQTIGSWERGDCSPCVMTLIPVADVLGMTLDELVGRSKR